MTKTASPRAWIHTRTSDDKAGLGLGAERHEYECRQLCERRGWTVVGSTDENTENLDGRKRKRRASAAKGGRQELVGLLTRIENREFDVLVTWAADRLVRSLADLEKVIEACQRTGVKLATVSGDLDLSTDAGRLVARILASVARGELERKSARFRSRFEQSLRDGTRVGGSPRRFGYKHGNMEVNSKEAPMLRAAYEMWTSGSTLGEIARWLDRQGSVTTLGRRWSAGTLRRLLANPANAGLRGTRPLLEDEQGRPVLNSKGEQQRAEWHTVVGRATWPAVVGEDVWRAAMARLQDPSRNTGQENVGRKHLLAGIAVCATCGRTMKTKTNNQQRSISCPTHGHATRKAEPVERYVKFMILERLRRPDAREFLQPTVPGVDVAALTDERDAVMARMRDLAKDEVLGRRSRDEVLAAREVASERVDEINATIEAVGRKDIVARFIGSGDDPGEVWEDPDTTLSMRQELITALAVIRIGSGRNGRPNKYSHDVPPPNVFVDFGGKSAE